MSLVMCLIDEIILFSIAVEQDNANLQDIFIHSYYQKWFYKQLTKLECTQHQHWIIRHALLSTAETQWREVLQSRNNQALITLTGRSFVSFVVEYQFNLLTTHHSLRMG